MEHESKKKVTLKDIAARTGLSVNTVSRVLNKKPYYTKEVEEKVNAACKELGYIVDMNASGLRSGSTHTIAIIFDDLVNPFYAFTTDIISRRFEEKGYNSIMFSNNGRTAYVDYELMRSVCDETGITITNVIVCLNKYYVIYYLATSAFATMQFYMQGNMFTAVMPKSLAGGNDEKLKQLITTVP